tara:strand:+ start:671 stop:1369 length:699 start_codon:yes stop_codon:yes gene_type:complete
MFSRRILVDIDALFDTRVGLVLNKFPEKYGKLDYEIYRKRISEVIFSVIGIDDWDKEWANRDIGALMQAQPTSLLLSELGRVLNAERAAVEMSAPTEVPKITLNVYPYEMSKEQMSEMARQMREVFPGFSIDIGRWCEKGLTPTTLRRSWDAWFTYDYYRWVNAQAENLKNRIPKFIIYRPALLTSDMTEEAAEQIKRDGINPFTESKKFMAEYVTVESLDASLFSSHPVES